MTPRGIECDRIANGVQIAMILVKWVKAAIAIAGEVD
jgi:hypothetical protein